MIVSRYRGPSPIAAALRRVAATLGFRRVELSLLLLTEASRGCFLLRYQTPIGGRGSILYSTSCEALAPRYVLPSHEYGGGCTAIMRTRFFTVMHVIYDMETVQRDKHHKKNLP